jgi:hypothetical protein
MCYHMAESQPGSTPSLRSGPQGAAGSEDTAEGARSSTSRRQSGALLVPVSQVALGPCNWPNHPLGAFIVHSANPQSTLHHEVQTTLANKSGLFLTLNKEGKCPGQQRLFFNRRSQATM